MLNFLKGIVSPPSPTAQSVAAPPTPTPVGPYMPGLRDTVLSGWFNQETDKLFSGPPISTEDTVLDVGCGDGGSVCFCAMRGARIVIADIDTEKIARARERPADTPVHKLECLVSDCDPLPLVDTTVTRVVSTGVIEYVDDPRQFLAELVRVGQPGALYLLSMLHPTLEDLQEDFTTDEHLHRPNHTRMFGEEQFATLMRKAGLEILNHSRYGFYWSLWILLFWEAKVDFGNPDHPLLEYWARTWQALLDSPRGPAIKQTLDVAVAKSQVITAHKPTQAQSRRNSSATAGWNSCRGHQTVSSNSRVVAPKQTNGSGAS